MDPHWDALEAPFRRTVELAWDSFRAGSLGIGAVITDADGTIVATGRNRLFEDVGGDDHLAGSPVAHAEMNALSKLRAGGSHAGYTLWTSLEPCLLCAGGIRIARVASVRFLASDPLWSKVADVPALDPFIEGGWPAMTGPLTGPFAAFALLLPFHTTAFWAPGNEAELAWRAHAPALGELAADLVRTRELVALASYESPVEEVIGELWTRLQAAGQDAGP
jgi:tRNA(Arg) A34 adenosine deaminase TadA